MNNIEVLKKIAFQLIGIKYGDLTTAEKNIYNILESLEILIVNESGDVAFFE